MQALRLLCYIPEVEDDHPYIFVCPKSGVDKVDCLETTGY